MGKAIKDPVFDAAMTKVSTGTRLTVCSGEPANFAGIAAVMLADVVVDSGDFATADGDVSGRKVTVGAQNAVPIDSSGTATHVAIDDGTTLLVVTTCTSQALTAGGTVNVPAHKYEITDPT